MTEQRPDPNKNYHWHGTAVAAYPTPEDFVCPGDPVECESLGYWVGGGGFYLNGEYVNPELDLPPKWLQESSDFVAPVGSVGRFGLSKWLGSWQQWKNLLNPL